MMEVHTKCKTLEEPSNLTEERTQRHARRLDTGSFSFMSTEDQELELTRNIRPTTLWHVLRVPPNDPSNPDGRLRTALPRSSVPKSKASYRNFLPKSDSALVPLLSSAAQSQSISVTMLESDQGDISDSLRRSSISSEFDLEPLTAIWFYSTPEFVTRAYRFHHHSLDGTYSGEYQKGANIHQTVKRNCQGCLQIRPNTVRESLKNLSAESSILRKEAIRVSVRPWSQICLLTNYVVVSEFASLECVLGPNTRVLYDQSHAPVSSEDTETLSSRETYQQIFNNHIVCCSDFELGAANTVMSSTAERSISSNDSASLMSDNVASSSVSSSKPANLPRSPGFMDLSQVIASSNVLGRERPVLVNEVDRSTVLGRRTVYEEDGVDEDSDIFYADVSTLDANDEIKRETATCQDQTGRESRGEIDSIIESYGENVNETARGKSEASKKTAQAQSEYRDFEKETARKCFKKPSDWEDTEKISGFLRYSARRGQQKTET